MNNYVWLLRGPSSDVAVRMASAWINGNASWRQHWLSYGHNVRTRPPATLITWNYCVMLAADNATCLARPCAFLLGRTSCQKWRSRVDWSPATYISVSEAIHCRKIKFLSKLQLSDKDIRKKHVWRAGELVFHWCCYIWDIIMDIGYFFSSYVN